MKKIYQLACLALLLLLAQKSYALACKKDGTQASDVVMINTTIAVPNTLPKDAVLWRSDNYSISVTCWQDRGAGSEYVYFYLSPRDQGLTQLGPDLELGIHLNGTDLRCTQLERCRVQLPIKFDGCYDKSGCKDQAQTFPLNFNFFLSKKSQPGPGKEGALTGAATYPAFQLDGVGGMNSSPDSNFVMILIGLNRLRYIACSSNLVISPKTVDFGGIAAASAQADKVIKEVPFSITAIKGCTNAYGLNAKLTPVAATVADGYTLVPNNNASVGISLLKQQDRSAIPFNKEFTLVEFSRDQVVVNNFLAQLKWRTNKAILGTFNATATIDVFYK
ncbi:fimbrial protein [Pseudomonas chlororaphis]|uniref:Fimbrial protein n=1 Tax=Pseudomonas chlororaphis subsp. aurantiaca TaxID=86192 RepID=A0AAJ1E4E4_9PSED|nr:fimbrial protein [Pseudomonas chlororaphis]MBU4636607.1 fimbrial protein [Pseudomonas chlororaphis subsp. aurantiaca]QIT26321.1 fimbrial protein [Pseudomonas chlororaphis subsp. aurantiaca]WDH07241.1 fimbrial protein [Pseudomonas chlororaphis]WDH13572.1 fimbrial protein [Pseudomonas chlororaphis]